MYRYGSCVHPDCCYVLARNNLTNWVSQAANKPYDCVPCSLHDLKFMGPVVEAALQTLPQTENNTAAAAASCFAWCATTPSLMQFAERSITIGALLSAVASACHTKYVAMAMQKVVLGQLSGKVDVVDWGVMSKVRGGSPGSTARQFLMSYCSERAQCTLHPSSMCQSNYVWKRKTD